MDVDVTYQQRKRVRLILFALLGLSTVIFCLFTWQLFESKRDRRWLAEHGAVILEQPQPPVISGLLDDSGQVFDGSRFVGKWNLLFFGYTHCPDYCPTTMAVLRQAISKMSQDAATRFGVYMVSVDPERDTYEHLATYLDFFSPDFFGITGGLEQVQAFAASVHIAFRKVVDAERPDDYLLDHSAQLVLIDPQGRYFGFLRPPFDAERLAETLQVIIRN